VSRSWLILREGDRRRWGGDLRRHYLLDGLAARTGGRVVEDRRVAGLTPPLRELGGPAWQVWRKPPLVASTEILTDKQFAPVAKLGEPAVVDIHDDALLQADALGIVMSAEDEAAVRDRDRLNRDGFRWLVAPSGPYARLIGLDPARTIVASNGTDSAAVRPGPWPETPSVAFVSGAAPRRGIEELVEAVRIARSTVPETRLDLVLAATGDESKAYLDRLRAGLAADDWVTIGASPYPELGDRLARSTVLAIPTPQHPYWDSVAPVKVFDYFAAGRPVMTTPREGTARLVRELDAGAVSADDSPEAMAQAIVEVLADLAEARRRGANARAAAERDYDWRVIGDRLADEILARIG
jgi:glycosyltransferase involved in cell wall biosynthesis